jgi:thymidylate synthase
MIKENIYNNFDIFYEELVEYILKKGTKINNNVRTVYADGTPAYYTQVVGLQFKFAPLKDKYGNYVALLPTTRQAPYKSAIKELEWIMVRQSNNVDELKNELGCGYWDEWRQEDGTIGFAYGRKIKTKTYNFNSQIDYIINEIKNNPNSRRIITEIWDNEKLDKMALTPCVHLTQWTVENNKLILSVRQRSCDVALGLVSNIWQYQVLQHLIAKECNLEVGELIWTVDNIHIYDRHIDKIKEQIKREKFNRPKFKINNFTGFYDFKWTDVEIINYEYGDKISYEVAI